MTAMDPNPSRGARPRPRAHAASGADAMPAEPELRFRFDYFDRATLRWEEKGSYAVPDADFEGVSYSWQHAFEKIVGSLVETGLVVTSLREYPHLFWRWFPWMVEDGGSYRLPAGMPEIPLMFSLTAAKPGEASPEGETAVRAGPP